MCQVEPARLPLQLTAVSSRAVRQIQIDTKNVYHRFLRRNLEYLAGHVGSPPLSMNDLLEPELAAIAVRRSERCDGERVLINQSGSREDRYDGHRFAARYRAAQVAS